jgi:hypothetical protein
VFPLIKISPVNPHMHRLLLGGGGVFFGGQFFLGALLWQRPSKGLVRSFLGCVARQQPVSNNREVFSLESVPKTLYHGKIVLIARYPQGPTIVGTGNGTLEVPELPSAWGYSWVTLSPGVINTDRMLARASSKFTVLN